ncbi:MAG: transglutaminaseTgpA domain-containing protein, partial [Propionibacteriaceae bacterium]|nr:transglutaminaseTgpA domain-containing protein [Propionibacteriaceae bacterium]
MTNWQVSWWGLVAVWATTFGLSNLLVLGPWLVMPLGLTATMMAAVLLVDRLPGGRRGRLSLAGLAAVVVWAGWLLVCCGHRTAGSGQSLATPWERVVSNVAASWEALPKYHRPVRQVDLFLPLVLLAIGAITLLVAVLLARAPSWSGLPLLIGWLCLLTADPSGAPLPLLIAVMAYLLVLGARRRSSLGLFGGHTTAVGMVIALALALALVLGLAGPRLPGWGRLASESSIWDGGLSRSV